MRLHGSLVATAGCKVKTVQPDLLQLQACDFSQLKSVKFTTYNKSVVVLAQYVRPVLWQ